MNTGNLLALAGVTLNTLVILAAFYAHGRKSGERSAVIETKLLYLERAVDDIKKSGGLTRRCTDCRARLDESAG